MNLSTVVSLITNILEYTLPAVFLWALVEKAGCAIVSAASGRKKIL